MTGSKLTHGIERMRSKNFSLEKTNILESILDSMDEAVLVVDSSGRELVRNLAFERLHFTVPNEVQIEHWNSAFGIYLPGGEELCPEERIPMVRAMLGESFDEMELEHVGNEHPQGLPISVSGRPLIGSDGVKGGVIVIRDNSGRKKLSDALLESEEQYRSVVESLAEGVVIHAADGSIVASNDKAADILGLSRDQIAGRTVLDPRWAAVREDASQFPGEELPAMMVLRTGRPIFNTIMGVRKPSGALTWMTVNAVPIRSAKGPPKGVVVSFHDITKSRNLTEQSNEQKQKLLELNEQLQLEIQNRVAVEKRLREQVAEMEALLQVIPVPVLISRDAECQVITGNSAGYEMLRLAPGKNLSKSAPAEEMPEYQIFQDGRKLTPEEMPMQRAAATGIEVKNEELELLFNDGLKRTAFGFAAPLFDVQQRVRGCVAAFFDITELRALRESLHKSEENYRTVVEDQTEVVARMRADGTFTFVNDIFCRTFGKSQSELIGKLWQPVAHPDDVSFVAAKLATLSPHNSIVIIENRVYNADGNIRWMEFVNRGFFNSNGSLAEIQAVGRDITGRKKIEEQLRNSLHEKEILLKEIHHRVKNNLQVISTLLDLQSSHTQDPAAIEMFRESRGRVKTMALIHENLYSSPDMSRVDIHANISQLAEHLRISYDARGIEILVDVDPVELPIDAAITCGLLVNELLSNCFKHAFAKSTSGRVSVCLHRVNVSFANESFFVLSVADNGVGYPPSFNFHDTRSFGVRLVHMLTRQLRGIVEMQSDQGTKIFITFPASIMPSHE